VGEIRRTCCSNALSIRQLRYNPPAYKASRNGREAHSSTSKAPCFCTKGHVPSRRSQAYLRHNACWHARLPHCFGIQRRNAPRCNSLCTKGLALSRRSYAFRFCSLARCLLHCMHACLSYKVVRYSGEAQQSALALHRRSCTISTLSVLFTSWCLLACALATHSQSLEKWRRSTHAKACVFCTIKSTSSQSSLQGLREQFET